MADPEQPADSIRPTDGDTGRSMDSSEADIEKLGRQRPAVFKNVFMEVGFCLSVLASNLVSVSPSKYPVPETPLAYGHVSVWRCCMHFRNPG